MTATEKYHAVLEGKMKEGEFVRQMRQAFPQYITQWNGYKDSVTILKQKQLIFEKKEVKKDITALADSFPIEAIERGIDMELESAGIDSTGPVSKEEYMKAKHKAVSNLQKDANHYLNLISGESAKVDKNDKMKETKRGKLESDTFNAMKKATLKENKESHPHQSDDKFLGHIDKLHKDKQKELEKKKAEPFSLREQTIDLIQLLKQERGADNDVIKDFIKTHFNDIRGASEEDILDEFDNFISVNYEQPSDFMEDQPNELAVDRMGRPKIDSEPSRFKGRDKSRLRTQSDEEDDVQERESHPHQSDDKFLSQIDKLHKDKQKELEKDEVEEAVNAYTPGDMFSTDFDYEGMLKAGLKIRINTPVDTMQKIYDSFEDVNYHRENAHLGDVIDAVKEGDKGAALDALKRYRREIKNTMSDIFEGAFPVRERDESYVPRSGVVKERVGGLEEFISLIRDRANDFDGDEIGAAEEVIEALGDHYGFRVEIIHNSNEEEDDGLRDDPRVDKHGNEEPEDGESSFGEAKGKDHDGDGDIDKDDYMAAKDKAIKKAMGKKNEMVKENLKAIISKVLEEGTINEAATQELARIADDYAGFEGMKGAILDLQNLVSDIEAYYDKTREKIQKVYNTLGEIRNEEGLKVGGFLAPAIETAFMKDLRPVTKQGFTKGLDQPKVRVISQKDIDAHNSGERPLGEDEFSPEPKSTVFTPNI